MKRKRNSDTATSSSTSGGNESLGEEFEVFLSFRGPDTRLNFTDHLYHSLDGAGIRVFMDNEEIRKGEKIEEELLRAIKDSRIYMPIFSRDYASSAWCLRELAHMVECLRRSTDKVILPIFFDVDSHDVKLRTGLYVDALKRHEDRFGYYEVQSWKEALTEVASICGWDCKDRGQGGLIKLITNEVSMRLAKRVRVVPNPLVGIDHHVRNVMYMLGKDSLDVRFVIIHGMGGIGGLPLSLVVIGSSLYWKSKEVWNDVLAKLKKMPHKEVLEVLKVSYDMLEYEQKEIFLDIACHMAGERRTDAIFMWSACQFYPNEAIPILINKSLIKIKDDHILMHDQLKDLGRELVRSESIKHPGERSRIWSATEAMDVIRNKEGTKEIVAFKLGGQSQVRNITREDISRMVKLRFLELDGGNFEGDFQNLLLELRWLSWQNCPSEFQVTHFSPSNLVVLKISESDITNCWSGWSQIMGKCRLKALHLVSCRRLIRTPNFSTCLTLERLVVKDCDRLVEIDPSITMLQHLKHLEIKGCIGLRVLKGAPSMLSLGMVRQSWLDSLGNLKCLSILRMENLELLELPDSIGEIVGLQVLSLSESSVEKLPESIGKLKCLVKLILSRTNIIELPDSIGELKRLEILDMEGCKLRKLPKAIGMLEKLEKFDAAYCRFLEGEIPVEIGELSSLKELDLRGTHISEVPPSISQLSQLTTLHLCYCEELQQLPELPTNLARLSIRTSALQRIPDLSNLTDLRSLHLSDHGRRRYVDTPHAPLNAGEARDLQWIGSLTKLEWLTLDLSDMTTLPADFANTLTELRVLRIPSSTFQSLEWIPPTIIHMCFCDLESTDGLSNLHPFKYLSSLEIRRSCLTEIPPDALGQLENLRRLMVFNCQFLERLSILPSLRKLRFLWIDDCLRLVEIQGLERSESLEELFIGSCSSLKELPDLSCLQNLSLLELSDCNSLESLPVVNKEICRLNVFKFKMLPLDSSPEFRRFLKEKAFYRSLETGNHA